MEQVYVVAGYVELSSQRLAEAQRVEAAFRNVPAGWDLPDDFPDDWDWDEQEMGA